MTYEISSRGGIRHKIDGDQPAGDDAERLLAAAPRDLPYTQCNRIVVPVRFHADGATLNGDRPCSRCFGIPFGTAARAARRAELTPGGTGIGDVRGLLRGIGAAQVANGNCDLETMVVVDLPGGTTHPVVAVIYAEDLAGALVIQAGPALPGDAGPGDLAAAIAAARTAAAGDSHDAEHAALTRLLSLLGGTP